MELLKVFLIISVSVTHCLSEKTPVTVTRTELKVSRSLDPENTQTLKVVARDGTIAQLIVKKRDAKSKGSQGHDAVKTAHPIYTNWIPVTSMVWSSNDNNKSVPQPISYISEGRDPVQSRPKVSNVIDSDIIPYIPRPVTIQSDNVYVKNAKETNKRARAVTVDRDGIPVIHGVRVPDDENDKHQTWRNARVINGELYPYEKDYKPPAAIPIGELVYATQQQINEKTAEDLGEGPYTKLDNFKETTTEKESVGPFTIRDNIDEPNRNSFVRFDDSTFGPFTKEDNLKYTNSKLIDYIKEINNKEAKRDYFTTRRYRAVDEASPQIQRRMLQYPGHNSYPNSAMYTPTTKLSPVNFNEGVRTPVLQYAHPELGVQPARIPSEDEERDFQIKPDFNANYELKPNRNFDIDRQSQYNPNSVEYYKKDVLNYPYGSYYVKPKPELPFWMKITESIKDNVQNGLVRMQQLTRPVFEPIVEASQKISYNLGLSKQQTEMAQKKVGILTPVSGSVILPALGLVAGGAALGLGAAAVGRFLEPNDMRALQQMYPNEVLVFLNDMQQKQHGRYRRSVKDDDYYMQNLAAGAEKNSEIEHLTAPHLWSDTPCSKKLFCEVMVKQSDENVVFMEKKMDTLLSIVHPAVLASVSHHLEDVMEAVRSKDCSRFTCRKSIQQ